MKGGQRQRRTNRKIISRGGVFQALGMLLAPAAFANRKYGGGFAVRSATPKRRNWNRPHIGVQECIRRRYQDGNGEFFGLLRPDALALKRKLIAETRPR